MSDRKTVDPIATWRELTEDQKEKIGTACIALVLGLLGTMQQLAPRQGFFAAEVEGLQLAADALAEAAPTAFVNGAARLPDLGVLGVRACRECGCTDQCGCEVQCHWVADDLCSSCREAG